jgi:hypothetical protein
VGSLIRVETLTIIIIVAAVLGIAGVSARDLVRVLARHLKTQTAPSAEPRPIAMEPGQKPAKTYLLERPIGATGWVEQVHASHRVFIAPDGRRSWAPINPSGQFDPDFAAL